MTLQMSSLGFSPLLPAIQNEFSMSYTQIGLFTGMYGLLALALSVPAGLAAKRYRGEACADPGPVSGGIRAIHAGQGTRILCRLRCSRFVDRRLPIRFRLCSDGHCTHLASLSEGFIHGFPRMCFFPGFGDWGSFREQNWRGFRMAHRDDGLRMRGDSGSPCYLGILRQRSGERGQGTDASVPAVPRTADGAPSARRLSGRFLHWWQWSGWLLSV